MKDALGGGQLGKTARVHPDKVRKNKKKRGVSLLARELKSTREGLSNSIGQEMERNHGKTREWRGSGLQGSFEEGLKPPSFGVGGFFLGDPSHLLFPDTGKGRVEKWSFFFCSGRGRVVLDGIDPKNGQGQENHDQLDIS